MDLRLTGKRALVTGGNRGIGKAIAFQLAREGVDVALAARDQAKLSETASEIETATGRKIVTVVLDTGSKESVDAGIEQAATALGGLDILVNAAAVPGGISSALRLEDIVDEEALLDIDIKVVGYLRTARAALPYLKQSSSARIVNIGGLALYKTGRPVATLRNVGVAAITKNLADELGPLGIGVVAIHPGATRTEKTTPEFEAQFSKANAIERLVDSSEVADIVAFLASPRSFAIHGDAVGTGGGLPGVLHY